MVNREDECTRFLMVARTADGREIDRQPAPICRHEERRIIAAGNRGVPKQRGG